MNVPIPEQPSLTLLTYDDVERLMYTTDGELLLSRRAIIPGVIAAKNTNLERGPEGVSLRLYDDAIITWHKDDTVTLRTGGWYTATTLARFNFWLPNHQDGRRLSVCMFNQYWYVGTRDVEGEHRSKATKETPPAGYVVFEEDINFDMITCTLVLGHNNIGDINAYNIEIEMKIAKWVDNFGRLTRRNAVIPPEDSTPQFVPFLLECLDEAQIPVGLLERVAYDLGYRDPKKKVSEWTRAPTARRVMKAAITKWLRSKLLIGPRARGRAIRPKGEK